jgi:hypothetical protein
VQKAASGRTIGEEGGHGRLRKTSRALSNDQPATINVGSFRESRTTVHRKTG